MAGGPRKYLVDIKGLFTDYGRFQRPEASCTQAVGWWFLYPGQAVRAPGYVRSSASYAGHCYALTTPPALVAGSTYAHASQHLAPSSALKYVAWKADGSANSAATVVGSLVLPLISNDAFPARFATSGGRLHVTSTNGVMHWLSTLDATSSYPLAWAGAPRGWVGPYTLTAGTLLASGYGRAYRVTMHRKDASGREIMGPPTARCTVRNVTGAAGYTGATMNARVAIRVPLEVNTLNAKVTSDWFWRLWASRTSDLSVAECDDDMFLISEAYFTAGDLAAGYLVVADNTPDAYLTSQPALHTNATAIPDGEENRKQGVLNASEQPPHAYELAEWQDCMWYANICDKPSVLIQTLTNLADGDTITIDGATYTARAAPAVYRDFQLQTGYANPAWNIEETISNLSYIVNADALAGTNKSQMFQVSLPAQLPGLFLIERNSWDNGAGAFHGALSVSASVAKFSPDISAAAETSPVGSPGLTYVAGGQQNVLRFSKPHRPSEVPYENELAVGPEGTRILALQPFRDRLLVFTTNGIYHVLGRTTFDFGAYPFDLSYELLGRLGTTLCDDRVYAICRQGFVEIDDGGVQVISLPIDGSVRSSVHFADGSKSLAYSDAIYHNVYMATEFGSYKYTYIFNTRTRQFSAAYSEPQGVSAPKVFRSACRQTNGTVSSGLVGSVILSCEQDSANVSRLYFCRRLGSADAHVDTTIDGAAANVTSTLWYLLQSPDPSAMSHFQELHAHYSESELQSSGQRSVGFATNFQSAFLTHQLPAPTSYSDELYRESDHRVIVPSAARRGVKLLIQLYDATNAAWSIDGITLVYTGEKGFGVK